MAPDGGDGPSKGHFGDSQQQALKTFRMLETRVINVKTGGFVISERLLDVHGPSKGHFPDPVFAQTVWMSTMIGDDYD